MRTWFLFAAVTMLLMCFSVAHGDDVKTVSVNEDGFSFHDDFWWKDSLPYTRTRVSSGGGWYRDYYGCAYYVQPTYSYSYSRSAYVKQTVTPKYVAPTPPAYTPNWQVEVLKYAEKRDDYQAYLKALSALGIQGQQYEFQQGTYLNGSYGNLALGSYGVSGSTIYGQMTFQQLQAAYGELNINTMFQQSSRGRDLASQNFADAQAGVAALVDRAGERQAIVAQILAEGYATKMKLDAARPTPSTATKGQGTVIVPGANKPMTPTTPMDAPNPDEASIQEAKAFLTRLVIPKCIACHGDKDPKGGFRALTWPTLDEATKAKYLAERIYTQDAEKIMPRGTDGKPGTPLTAAEKRDLATH